MKKMFLTTDIKQIDQQTIVLEPISSVALMHRAALTVFNFIIEHYDTRKAIVIAGSGNNGGDGLAVADMLSIVGWEIEVWSYSNRANKRSADCQFYFDKLQENNRCSIHINEELPSHIEATVIVIDALFGTGLSRPVERQTAQRIELINSWNAEIISIDLPSGLRTEETFNNEQNHIIKATHTISFQFPKLAFFLPETAYYVGQWHITDIGLHPSAIEQTPSLLYYMTADTALTNARQCNRFANKEDMGRALLVVGSFGMMGAATFAAKACVNSGVGVLTTLIPRCGYEIMQINVPEALALCSDDNSHNNWSASYYKKSIKALGIGPGIGRNESTTNFLRATLDAYKDTRIVIDADALFHLRKLMDNGYAVPPFTILTPHEGEFDRLTHPHNTRFERLKTATDFASSHNVIVVLKGAYTTIVTPDKRLIFNTTGNAGMATGGSGDILTGVITALLAQGYQPEQATILAVNIHANTGDKTKEKWGERGVTASRMLNLL